MSIKKILLLVMIAVFLMSNCSLSISSKLRFSHFCKIVSYIIMKVEGDVGHNWRNLRGLGSVVSPHNGDRVENLFCFRENTNENHTFSF